MSKLRTRILAFLLAISMLVGYVLPAGAEANPPAAEPTGEVAPEPAPEPEVQPTAPAAQPEEPEQPEVAPTQPAPEEPTEETEPEAPTEAEPTEAPTEPTSPEEPTEETQPEEPTEETQPEEPTEETEPEQTEPEDSYPEPMLFYAAPVEEYPVYGMNVVYPGTDTLCGEFLVNAATAVRCGGTLYVTLGVSGSYPYLYLGSQAELEDQLRQGGPFPVVEGVNNNGEALFHFATGAGDNSRMTVCLVAADAGCERGYQVQERELVIPLVPTDDATLPDVPQEDVIETVSAVFAAAPLQEQDITGKLYLAEKEQEAPYAPFAIEKATALRVEDVVYVTMYVVPGEGGFPYSNLYMGQLSDLVNLVSGGETASTVEGTADEQGSRQTYHFTLAAGQLGTRVPVCALGDDMTMEGILAAKELDLIVPAEVPEAKKEPTPTPISYPAAPFDEQDVSGKLFVAKQGADAVYPMFKIETATAVKDENNIYVTVQVNPAASGAFTYSYLYFGTRTDLISQLDKGGPFDVVAGVNGAKQSYHFTLPLSAEGSRVPVCILKGDLNTKSPYNSSELELVIPQIPEGKAVPVPTPVSYPAAPFDEQDVSGKLFVAKQNADAIYPMFKIETATAVKDENNIYVTVQVNPAASGAFTYSYLYFGTRTDLISQLDKGGPFDVVAGVNGAKQSYHFTLPLSAEGSRVPVCILKGDLNTKSPYNSSELELVIPQIPEGKAVPVPTPVSYPAAPFDEQDVSGKLFVAKQNADAIYPMFKIETATAVKDENNIYVTVQVNPAASGAFTYSYLYFGTRTDLISQLDKDGPFDVVAGVNGSKQSYHFTLPLSAEGSRVPVCILKGDLNAKSPYNSSELELVIPQIPEGKAVPVPTPVSYPAAPFDEQDVSGKLFVAKQNADAIYPMFKIETATAVKDENNIYVTVQVNPAASGAFTYSYLYFGTRTDLISQLDKDGPFDVVAGVNGSKQSYHFTLPLSAEGSRVPVCILKGDLNAKSPYNSSELELVIPEIPEGKAVPVPTPVSYPAAPFDEQDVSGKLFVAKQNADAIYPMFKIETATAVKDENNIYVTVQVNPAASGAFTYSYLYFGTRTDLISQLDKGGPFDVVAGVNGSKQSYHFTLPLTAEGSRVPVCILKGDLNAKSPYNSSELELVIPQIPEGKAVPVPTPVSYPAAPFDEQDVSGKLFVAKQNADAIYPMFKIETATAVKDENNIYVTVQVNPAASGAFTYSYLYFGTRTDLISQLDKDGPFDVVAGVNGSKQSYHFTLPLSAEGSRVPVCILKGDLNAKSPYNSSELELVIPEIPEGKAVPVPTPVSYPAAPFDEQDVSGKLFVAKQNADAIYPMFKIETATAVKDENNIYVTVQVNPAASGAFTYSYLYFGTRTDLISQLDKGGPFDVVAGVNGSKQSYHFTLPLTAEGSRVPVCILKGDLNAKSPYNSSELELVIPQIPEGKAVPVPTPVSYPAAPFDEQDVSGKLFVAKQNADAIYPMFKIETATAVKDENNIYVTVQVNPAASGAFTYSYLYFGTRTDLISQLDKGGPFDVVAGVNGNKQSYHFTLPLSAEGSRVPVCILKGDLNAKSPYNSSELELVIPQIPEGKAVPVPTPVSYPAASVPERDITGLAVVEQGTANAWGDFPVISATGIRVEDKLYITALVGPDGAGSFPYAYLYFGSRTQLEEQLHKGGAFDVVAGIGDGQKQSYHFTLPAPQAGSSISVCLVKADLTAENPYNTTDLELVIPEIPEETAQAAPAIPALPDTLSEANIKVIKAEDGAQFKMFTADKTGMAVAGDTLLIHFETSNPSFDALYFGSKEDGMKSPYVQGVQKDGKWVFEFALPASYRGGQNPICLRKTDGTWYANKDLLLSIPADSGDSATVKDDAGIIMAPTSSWNQVSFVIQTSSAMLLGDRIYVTITGQMGGTEAGNVADKLYLGSRKDEDKSSFVPGTCNSDGTTTFRFSVPADKQGTSIPAVVGYSSGIWHTNQDFFLNIPNFNRHFDAGYYTDGVYDLYGNAYAYLDKVDSRGLAIDEGSTLTVSGDKIIIKWVTRATDTDKLYFGQQTDAIAIREAQSIGGTPTGMLNYQEFTITLPRSSLSTGIPFVRHSPLWFADTNGWLEKQDYLVLADCLPRISDAPDDTGATIAPAGMKMLAGGSEVEQMFVVTDSAATRKGDVITCTVTGRPYASGSGPADRLYLGAREDQDKSNYITGTVNADGSTTFTFDVPADNQGLSIRVVVSFEKTGWHTVQDYFLNIPNFDSTFDLSYYTDGVYDLYGNAYAELSRTQNKSFPVDKGSTLSVAGDKIVIKWVCRSGSYDMVYFGAVSDDEAVRNAAAAKIADYPGEATWKVYTVTLPKSALASRIPMARHSSKWYTDSNGWLTTQDYLVLANRLPKSSDTPDIPAEPSKPGTEIAEGVYNTTAETGAAMFKVVKAVLDASGGKYRVTLTLSGTGYDYLCTGTAAQAPSQQSQWAPAKIVNCTINGETRDFYTYTLEVDDPTKPIAIASHSKKNDAWYDRTVTLDVSNLRRTARDGNYQVTASCEAAMFKIVDAKLKVVNGQMLAELTLNGTGYDYLYPGSGSQAEQDKANWAPFQKDGEGKYVYTLPVTQLDVPIVISSHSAKKGMWYDRTVTFLSGSLKPIGGTEPTTPTEPTEPTTPTEPTEPTTPTEPSMDGTTSAVNSATKLKDGTYKQDGFTYSGGSGRVSIACDKVIIKGGKSYAVIRFVSKSSGSTSMDYKYVKASNGVYYPAGDGSFTIPVELNTNNRILGMTAKMTAAHEIEYTIYVQLKKAESAATSTGGGGSLSKEKETDDPDSKLDKQAPEILGLEFKEVIQTPGARYLKLFQYDQGVVLAEVDLRRDTVLDTEEAIEELAQADLAAKARNVEAEQTDEPAETVQITSDYVAAQYRGDVLKYLLVPAGVELPAGLEKDYLIVHLPVKSIYLMDEDLAQSLDALGALGSVSVLTVDCQEEALMLMIEEHQKLPGGTWQKPDYRTLIKAEVDLGLIGNLPLPLSREALEERKQTAPAEETLSPVEYRDRLTNLTDRFAVLDIPLILDRSADEPEARGRAAWMKLYGILYGKQELANRLYDAAVAKEEK